MRGRSIILLVAGGLAVVGLVRIATRDDATPDARLQALATGSLSTISGRLRVPGLRARVTVVRDRWGVPHIDAQNVDDLFFAQGYVMAQDRLWQMEVWRRTREGRLAEWLGPRALPGDRLARRLMYRGEIDDDEWEHYHPEGKRIFAAYAAGVNAFIAAHGNNLPIEFKLTGLVPERWTPEVLVLRTATFGDGAREVQIARDLTRHGVAEASRRHPVSPADDLAVPDGVDLSIVDDAVVAAVARVANDPVTPELVEPYRSWAGVPSASSTAVSRPGSNNWVLGGRLSVTGKPAVANDPHRELSTPSLRYIVHLRAPGWNVIGSSEPPFIGVAIGHNDHVAWGMTFVAVDQEDIYIEELNPANPNEVRWRGGWEPLRVVREAIVVRGATPEAIELAFSRHGPIFHVDRARNRAYALRSARHEPGTAPYLAALRLSQTRSCREFFEAAMYWRGPPENLVCGDVDGGIGWQASAIVPRRSWSGRLPVSGTGDFEWAGFRTDLPRELDPVRGYIATANNSIQIPGVPALGFRPARDTEFERVIRLEQMIQPGKRYTIEDQRRMQLDVLSLRAASQLALFRGWTSTNVDVERARRAIAEWDARLVRESAAAALYATWRTGVTTQHEPQAALEAGLAGAIEQLTKTQGADWTAWRWGRMHSQAFRHPLTSSFDLATVERSGGLATVADDGASYRQILDTSDWDRSIVTNTPGQSGQPASPFYGNLLPLWAEDRYFPLVFSPVRVHAEAAHTLVLEP